MPHCDNDMTNASTAPLKTPFHSFHVEASAKMVEFAGYLMPVQYAGMTAEPRALLTAVEGVQLTEMERCKADNFCCGAGGGRMWMEEEAPRINNVRAEEALATGAELICTACPFCLTMLDDGVKAAKRDEDVKVLDLAEIIERATA